MSDRRKADMTGDRPADAGFTLLLVLWWVGLLALIGTRATASGREQSELARNMLDRARMEAAADGAVSNAIFRYATGDWPADARAHVRREASLQIEVELENENGRINPNEAPPGLLRALLHVLGLPADRAAGLAAALTDWHTPGDRKEPFGAKSADYRAAGLPYGPADAPFTSMTEVRLVLGMTDGIFDALKPHLSIAVEGDVDRAQADPAVLGALATFGRNVLPAGLSVGRLSDVVRIRASVRGALHAAFVREAVVRFPRTADPSRPSVEILAWEAPVAVTRTIGYPAAK